MLALHSLKELLLGRALGSRNRRPAWRLQRTRLQAEQLEPRFTPTVITLASFGINDTPGYEPGGLIIDSNGNLFGTTLVSSNVSVAAGTVFELQKGSGTIQSLASFGDSNGAYPGGLIEDSSGNLFGVTSYGPGTVFEVQNGSATVTTLATFDNSNGPGTAASLERPVGGTGQQAGDHANRQRSFLEEVCLRL